MKYQKDCKVIFNKETKQGEQIEADIPCIVLCFSRFIGIKWGF